MKHLILLLVVLLNAIAASAACTPDDYDRITEKKPTHTAARPITT